MTENVSQLVEASKALNADEQMELFDALWEIVDEYAQPDAFELSREQVAELERRWERHLNEPESAVSWEEGKARLSALRQLP